MQHTQTRQQHRPTRRFTRIAVICAATLALLQVTSSPASAEPRTRIDALLQDINYDALGTTTVQRAAQGYLLQVTELQASGTVSCQGCGPLNGAIVTISQELNIVIVGDILEPVISGRTEGQIEVRLGGRTIANSFSGRLSAPSIDVTTCTSEPGCNIALMINAATPGSGSFELNLIATLHLDGGVPSLSSITGTGVAQIVIDVIGAG